MAAEVRVQVPVPMEAVAEFCRRHDLREFALFGSVLRDDFAENSDVDVVIEPGPNHRHRLAEILSMQEELEAVFGRKVDIVYKQLLKPYIRDDVLRRRRVFYVFPQ